MDIQGICDRPLFFKRADWLPCIRTTSKKYTDR